MNVVILGVGLSYQRIPSRAYFEENLVIQRDDPPVMVEHPGEVVLEALESFQGGHRTGLTLIPSHDLPEYGFYLSQLEERFGSIELTPPRSSRLVDLLEQAGSILKKQPGRLVVISETTLTGSAAVVISTSDLENEGLASLHLPNSAATSINDFELAGFAGELDQSGLDRLGELIAKRTDGRPVSLVSPGSYGQPEESLLNLIQICLAIKEKTLPFWNPLQHSSTDISQIPALQVNPKARAWLAKRKDFQRCAILLGRKREKSTWQALFLEEILQPTEQISIRHINSVHPYLFLVRADEQEGLTKSLESLAAALNGRDSLGILAQNAYAQYRESTGNLVCSLLASTREALQKEIDHAISGLAEAFRSGDSWTSPAGSYFTPLPLGNQDLAFVYPGAFNSYPGMGQDLFFSFPGLQDAALQIIPDLSYSLAEDILANPPEVSPSTDQAGNDGYTESPSKLIESGISLSVIYTLILKQVFALTPGAAFGYSLGETSMLWANQVWQDAHNSSEAWSRSPLFKDQLAGEMKLIREAWNSYHLPEDFWGTFILKDSFERVDKACQAEELVSVTIQNAPDEIVIAGEKQACARVIKELGCHALPMPLNAAIHHPAMGKSQGSFEELYTIPTSSREDIRFYTAANYGELTVTQQELARSIAQMTCNPVDFPRLVNKVYQDGARIFLEVGPQKTCSRWIEKILKGKPHVVLPINKRYQDDLSGIFKVLAMLLSHGVALDLNAIFPTIKRSQVEGLAGTATSVSLPAEQPLRISQQQTDQSGAENTLAITQNLDRISSDLARSHSEFLVQQSNLTKALTRVVRLQAEMAPGGQTTPGNVLYSRDQIQAFTNGDHRLCFDDLFSGFGERRFPRLPNGPLQLIDRVIHLEGKTGHPSAGGSLISEVELSSDAWYWKGQPLKLPHVALMEIALQPCGFLSAYLGTIQGREDQDLYFRNLDGEASLLYWPDQLGPVITNRVKLESTSSLDNVIIQNFTFTLYQGDSPFFKGSSSFGYFPLAMLVDQAGLDGNASIKSWRELNPSQGAWQENKQDQKPVPVSSKVHIPEVDRLWVANRGGTHQQGYVFVEQKIPRDAWFYKAHFYQDPVMPGSLGVETMARSLMAAAPNWEIPEGLSWRIQAGSQLSWKYRGQITPETPHLALDLHLKSLNRTAANWEICADGQLWNESKRIYQVENLCLESISSA